MDIFPTSNELKLISANNLKVLITHPKIAKRLRGALGNKTAISQLVGKDYELFPHIIRVDAHQPKLDASPNKLLVEMTLKFNPSFVGEPHHVFCRISKFLEQRAHKSSLCIFDGIDHLDINRVLFFCFVLRLYPLATGSITLWPVGRFSRRFPETRSYEYVNTFDYIINSEQELQEFEPFAQRLMDNKE